MSLKGPTQVKDKKQWQGLIKIIAYIFVVILMIIFIFLLVSLWIKIDQFQIIQ
jgi:type VI protein secretion system component VasF